MYYLYSNLMREELWRGFCSTEAVTLALVPIAK